MDNAKTILILTASPKDTARLRLNEEVREIEEGLKLSLNRDLFVIRSKWAVRLRDLRRAMLEHEPRIVHFCGHGEENGIKVEDESGNAILVNSDALAGLFECFSSKVECVILNACYSQSQAEAISEHIPYVIGMNKDIQDNTAVEFAVGFYDALGAGKSIEEAFMFGRNAIALYNLPEHLTPILNKKSDIEQSWKLEQPKEPPQQSPKSPKVIDYPSVNIEIKVFISYAREDRKIAKKLYNDLKIAGVTPWLDSEDLLPGQQWKVVIEQAIKESSYVLALLSSNSISRRGFVQKELKIALDLLDEFPSSEIFIVPARLDDCEPYDERLKDLHWIDIFPSNETSYETGLNKILHALLPEEEKGLRALLEPMREDLRARESELLKNSSIRSKQWFVQEISRCNVGERYINRSVKVDGKTKRLAEEVNHWLGEQTSFRLTKQSFNQLRDENISEDILDKLETLENQEFIDEKYFLNAVKKYIGEEQTVRYKTLILKHAGPRPYLFVVGSSGIGKTNSLIAEVIAPIVAENIELIPPKKAIVFFRLGSYNPELTLWSNFEKLVNSRIQPEVARLSEKTFKQLVKNGTILLVLDGLDEFIRVWGNAGYGFLVSALRENVDNSRSKIIISCRKHIYKRLNEESLFKQRQSKIIEINQLEDNEVKEALKKRLRENSRGNQLLTGPQALSKFEGNPLLLEMMCGIPEKAWHQLHDKSNRADLYDLWFEEIIMKNQAKENHLCDLDSDDIRKKIGEIAICMLEKRSDFLGESIYQHQDLLPALIDVKKQKLLGIFIKQTETDWSFVHDSFREFSLAKKLAGELLSGEYDFLKRTPSFDYLNAEVYEFVYQVLQSNGGYVSRIKQALESNTSVSQYTEEEWNNIVRNSFEAIGMIADDDLERLEASIEKPGLFIQMAKKILCLPSESPSITLSYKTKYNIARALERLHLSGPERPYCKHDRSIDWEKPPSLKRFGTWVVQGVGRSDPIVRLFPPTIFRTVNNDCSNAHQEEISDCLLSLLKASVDQAASKDDEKNYRFLQVNASFALIRWLYIHNTHLEKLKEGLEHVQSEPKIKGNLFLALFRLGDKDIFKQFPHYFDGMKLRWVPEEIANTAIEAGYRECDIKLGADAEDFQ